MDNGSRGALGSLLDELALDTGSAHKRKRDAAPSRRPQSEAPPSPVVPASPPVAQMQHIPERVEPTLQSRSQQTGGGWLLSPWGTELGFLLGRRPPPVVTAGRAATVPEASEAGEVESPPESPLLAPWGRLLGQLSGKRVEPLSRPRVRPTAARSPGLTIGEFLETSQWA